MGGLESPRLTLQKGFRRTLSMVKHDAKPFEGSKHPTSAVSQGVECLFFGHRSRGRKLLARFRAICESA